MDGLDDSTKTADTKYSGNSTKSRNKICLSLHYNAANSFYALMVRRSINSEQKTLKQNHIDCAW